MKRVFMRTVRKSMALLALFAAGPWCALHADDEEAETDEVPVVGRPADLPFSGASGRFTVTSRATPTTVEAETPFTFIISVRATGAVRRPPQRLDLRQLLTFADDFYIEDPDDGTRRPDDRTWDFVYRLKPRRTDVTEVPGLPFVYFDPSIRPAAKGFQVIYTEAIPLRVVPHQAVAVPVQAPESAFTLATGPAVLARQTPWAPPGAVMIVLLLLTPPVLCAAWYVGWRRLYPDAARQASQRRSRAARHALQALRGARRLPPEECAARAAAVVAGYLHERLDLVAAEPTPREVADLFAQRGGPPALTREAAQFFQACDSARFLPAPPAEGPDLPASAAQLILALEAQTCPPGRS
jgi:hypothetical protein